MKRGQVEFLEGFIYFIKAENGLIKIGFSTNPKARLKDLKTGSPIKIEMSGHYKGYYYEEKELHKRFKKHLSHGEWFHPSSEILNFIGMKLREDV